MHLKEKNDSSEKKQLVNNTKTPGYTRGFNVAGKEVTSMPMVIQRPSTRYDRNFNRSVNKKQDLKINFSYFSQNKKNSRN